MMSMPRFITIRGRRIYIGKKPREPDKKEIAKGAGLTGAGVATGAVLGSEAANQSKAGTYLWKHSKNYQKQAKKFETMRKKADTIAAKHGQTGFGFNIPNQKAKNYAKISAQYSRKARNYRFASRGLKYGGVASSGALIGSGLGKIYQQVSGKDPEKSNTLRNATTAGAFFAVSAGYGYSKFGGQKRIAKALDFAYRVARKKF